MHELNELLKPSWGSEYWIQEGWDQINDDEKVVIKNRINELFKDGLPFELKHDKLLYIYAFSLLAQLEVLAIQVPLKFQHKMTSPAYRERMRVQLLDEIFHGLVFTRIVYMLCAPRALPPAYNDNIELICNFIRNEECPKVAVMLLNLIGEGWIEEVFYSFKRQGIAPRVFDTIIEDEHRHVSEADLYHDIGLPDMATVAAKMAYLEDQLLTNLFMQYKYMFSMSALLGVEGIIDFLQALNTKHVKQLNKIGLKPGESWNFFMKTAYELFPKIQQYCQLHEEIPMTPIRKVFMTQWSKPSDPTMVGEFNLNVSFLDFFNKKFPPDTITLLMLQTISLSLSENPLLRAYLSHNTLYRSQAAYLGLIVKLPECGDHIGTVVFENCHNLTSHQLSLRIRSIIKMMAYCFHQRQQLEILHPHLTGMIDKALYEFNNDDYDYPFPGNAVVSLSNIGAYGYTQTKSPLRVNEAMKFTLLEIERKPVWNKQTQAFEPQDILPVSISADHRIFDGNVPVPKMLTDCLARMFTKMKHDMANPRPLISHQSQEEQFKELIEQSIANNVEMTYKILMGLQTYWLDFIEVETLLSEQLIQELCQEFA